MENVGMNTADIPKDPAQRWEWIKYQLRVKDTSLAKIARSLGVTGPAVKNAKHSPYPRVERAIAEALGMEPVLLWPDRWDGDGEPCRRRPNRAEVSSLPVKKHTAAYDLGHRKTGTGE